MDDAPYRHQKARPKVPQRQVRTKLITPQSWTPEQKMYIWEKWERRRGTCSMVTFAKEVRLEGIKDGMWDVSREFNRNVVAGIVGGLKLKFAGGSLPPPRKRPAPPPDGKGPALKRERFSESEDSFELENSFSAHEEESGVYESEDSVSRRSAQSGDDVRVRRAEAEVLKCREELQQLNSKIDGIVALLQGLSGILPPHAIETLIHETKNNDLHEAAASLTNLFAVTASQ